MEKLKGRKKMNVKTFLLRRAKVEKKKKVYKNLDQINSMLAEGKISSN